MDDSIDDSELIEIAVYPGASQAGIALWREAMSKTGEFVIDSGSLGSFSGLFRGRIIGNMMAMRTTSVPFRYVRDAAWLKQADRDVVFVNFVERGRLEGYYSGRFISAGPGALVVTRLLQTMDLIVPAEWTGLLIPKETLDDHLVWHRDFDGIVYAPGSMTAILLGNYIDTLLKMGALTSSEKSQVLSANLSLVTLGLGGKPASPKNGGKSRNIGSQAKLFISKNLRNNELNSDLIATELGVSQATLRRSLGSERAIAANIRKIRLQCAYRDVLSWLADEISMRDIATRWGFSDDRSFRRAFKREFGFPPSELRSGVRQVATVSEDARRSMVNLLQWFQCN